MSSSNVGKHIDSDRIRTYIRIQRSPAARAILMWKHFLWGSMNGLLLDLLFANGESGGRPVDRIAMAEPVLFNDTVQAVFSHCVCLLSLDKEFREGFLLVFFSLLLRCRGPLVKFHAFLHAVMYPPVVHQQPLWQALLQQGKCCVRGQDPFTPPRSVSHCGRVHFSWTYGFHHAWHT